MPSVEQQQAPELGSVWVYEDPVTNQVFKTRVKGTRRPSRNNKDEGEVYLVPAGGRPRDAHKLPSELQGMTMVRFWELVVEQVLHRIDSP
ncbi:hypothetical protein HY379_02260 [Candidatus Saccharibacteria bacterium]|nr:hypothetical protein [Candidatus Saccharibacteria bacterium]